MSLAACRLWCDVAPGPPWTFRWLLALYIDLLLLLVMPGLVTCVVTACRGDPNRARLGCQVAGDANTAGHVYPDQSLYPCNSVPVLVERINNALQRADQVRA